jgi:hypothetical protein
MRRLLGWLVVLFFSGVGLFCSFLCAIPIVFLIGQTLTDSDEEEAVSATLRYFGWAAGAFVICCGAAGVAIGWRIGRLIVLDHAREMAAERARRLTKS